MSNKGYPSSEVDLRLKSDHVTVEPIREKQHGLTILAHSHVMVVSSAVVIEAGSTTTTIIKTSHGAKKGDVLYFKTGALAGQEVKVDSITDANTIVLSETLSVAPTAGDTYDLLRHKYPKVGSDGGMSVNVTSGAIAYTRDGADQVVIENTSTPASNIPLPVKILDTTGIVNVRQMVADIATLILKDFATAAKQDALLAELQLKADLTETQPVSAASLPLPAGASTSANQSTVITALGNLLTELQLKADLLETQPVSAASLPLPTGAAAETTLADIKTAIQILDNIVSGNEAQVDVLTMPNVTINRLSVVDFIDTTPVLDTSSTNITASAGTPVTIVASLAAAVKKIKVFDTTGEFIGLYSDPAGSPILLAVFGPGMDSDLDITINASTALGLRNMANAAISVGKIAINFMG